jgi:hypothetical protein
MSGSLTGFIELSMPFAARSYALFIVSNGGGIGLLRCSDKSAALFFDSAEHQSGPQSQK